MNTINFSRFHTIVTHDGIFHADEVAALELARMAGFNAKTIRTRDKHILQTALADPNVLVLDCGGQYDPEMGNFDHHQDKNATTATAGLVWNFVKNQLYPNNAIAQKLVGEVINAIDAFDLGLENAANTLGNDLSIRGYRSVSQMVSGFNRVEWGADVQDEQFQKAQSIIENEIYAAVQRAKAEKIYECRKEISPNVALFFEFCPIWKEKNQYNFAVMPYTTVGQWQIVSSDSVKYPLPEKTVLDNLVGDKLIFRHQSGFMATFADFDSAMEVAKCL